MLWLAAHTDQRELAELSGLLLDQLGRRGFGGGFFLVAGI